MLFLCIYDILHTIFWIICTLMCNYKKNRYRKISSHKELAKNRGSCWRMARVWNTRELCSFSEMSCLYFIKTDYCIWKILDNQMLICVDGPFSLTFCLILFFQKAWLLKHFLFMEKDVKFAMVTEWQTKNYQKLKNIYFIFILYLSCIFFPF